MVRNLPILELIGVQNGSNDTETKLPEPFDFMHWQTDWNNWHMRIITQNKSTCKGGKFQNYVYDVSGHNY